jgi:hypothetical protein
MGVVMRVDLHDYSCLSCVHLCKWQITERDEAALKYLQDIKWNNLDDNKGFLLEFYFNSNPYFKNPMVFPHLFYVKAVEVQRDSLHRVSYNFFLDILVSGLSSVGSFSLALNQNVLF